MTLFKNWQTTALGITAWLAVAIKIVHDFLAQNVHIGLIEVLGVILGLMGVRARDASTTPTGKLPE